MKIKASIKNLKKYLIFLKIEQAIEEFLTKRGYLKIDLPVLSPSLIPESYLEVFETEFKYLRKREKLYLTPSPELFMKRLLALGIGDCFYLGKSFRNSELNSSLHSFEFTMLEFYKVGVNYLKLADEVLALLRFINAKTGEKKTKNKNNPLILKYKNKIISLARWEKIKVSEAFQKYADIKEEELFNYDLFAKKLEKKGYQVKGFSYQELWSQVYSKEIEPKLGNYYPTLIYDFPKEFAALARLNSDGKTAQRFEFYIAGVELGDCYTELTDWQQQEERFIIENKKRRELGMVNHPIDKGFIEALKYGLPFCSGIAIGVERLAMIFAGASSIDNLKLIKIKSS
mgnify:CR=1 FL=1